MSVTFNTPRRIAGDTWRLSWSSDLADPPSPVFWVYRDGRLIQTSPARFIEVTIPSGGSPLFDVRDDDTPPAVQLPSTVVLTWYAVTSAAEYRVEQWDGASWILKSRILDRGQGYFVWESGILADSTTAQFRVTAMGTNGNLGTATTMNVLIVRNPDPPSVTFVYNGALTPTVTIAAATTASSPGGVR